MSGFLKKNIDKADDIRTFDKGHVDALELGEVVFGRAVFEPGWKWSECVKPLAGTDLCMVHHNGFVVSGSLHIVMADGAEHDINAGDVFVCPPGHDAWVTSSEACIAYDFSPAAADYAKPAEAEPSARTGLSLAETSGGEVLLPAEIRIVVA